MRESGGAGRQLTNARQVVDAGVTRLALRRTRRLVEGQARLSGPARDRLMALAARLLAPGRGGGIDSGLASAVIGAFEGFYQPVAEQDMPAADVRDVIVRQFGRLYYHDSHQTWRDTWYRGVRILKCPLDLWQYQELIHELRPDVIVETGTAHGGSAYYLGDLCHTVGRGQVVSIDIDSSADPPPHTSESPTSRGRRSIPTRWRTSRAWCLPGPR